LLKRCAISRKFAGLIPEGVIGTFYSHNSTDRVMALGPVSKADKLTTFC
jgi:hypothetical protein